MRIPQIIYSQYSWYSHPFAYFAFGFMEFNVPQFIEREPKIFGPFTFKQFIFIGIAGAISIFLYFTIKSFFLFLLLAGLVMGIAFGLALLRPGGIPLPTVIQNLCAFIFKPKIYLWRKKALPTRISKKEVKPEKEVKEEPVLKVAEKSHLRDLFARLETRVK